MKIRVYSDLHLEFWAFDPPNDPCDLVVLAGDVHINRRGLQWAMEKFPSVPVAYVLGNHEYYGRAVPKLTNELRAEAAGSNVHVLDQDEIVVGSARVLGCTFWTNFELHGAPDPAVNEAEERMTDFKRIRITPGFRRLHPVDTVRLHRSASAWLEEKMLVPFHGRTIVVSHHAPSGRSLPDRWLNESLSAAYASPCESLIEQFKPDVWIHGHVHHRSDYTIGSTRVVCNPRGYNDEPVDGFDPGFTIELSTPTALDPAKDRGPGSHQ